MECGQAGVKNFAQGLCGSTWTKHCVQACPAGTLLAEGLGAAGACAPGSVPALSLAERAAPLRVVRPAAVVEGLVGNVGGVVALRSLLELGPIGTA